MEMLRGTLLDWLINDVMGWDIIVRIVNAENTIHI
jgi:hypothetical protein